MSIFAEKYIKGENAAICNNCKHYKSGETCAAFSFIPDLILLGDNDHSKPLPSQKNNIVFEPLENAKKRT
jgi:hypothetical protein